MKYHILISIFFISVLINACTPSQDESASASIQDIQSHGDHGDEDNEEEPRRLDSSFYPKSFFGEYFHKERLEIKEESFELVIPFDMHDRGSMAPDCYVEELRLTFPNLAPFSFPQQLPFEEVEHGCVDSANNISGRFILAEDNDSYVQYHSVEPSRLLILFRNYKNGTLAYYFSDGDWNGIYGKNLDYTLRKFSTEGMEDFYPSRSSVLMQVE